MTDSTVLAEVRTLAALAPLGFAPAQLAQRLGGEYEGQRLKDLMRGLTRRGVLTRADHGIYVAGPGLTGEAPAELDLAVREVFEAAGGIITWPELTAACGRPEPADQGPIREALRRAPFLYRRGVSVPGVPAVWWKLADDVRRRLALPGRWIELDLRLTVRRMAPGHVDWTQGLASAFARRRRAIGNALLEARLLMGAEAADAVGVDEIGGALADCLGFDLGEAGVWWAESDHGQAALASAWARAEAGEAAFLRPLDCRFWRAAGAWAGLDAADLSRGAVS